MTKLKTGRLVWFEEYSFKKRSLGVSGQPKPQSNSARLMKPFPSFPERVEFDPARQVGDLGAQVLSKGGDVLCFGPVGALLPCIIWGRVAFQVGAGLD